MKDENAPSEKGGFRKWLKDSFIQECPPELYACEVCGQYECDSERWLNCEHRLKVRDQLLALSKEADRKSQGNIPCPSLTPKDASPES